MSGTRVGPSEMKVWSQLVDEARKPGMSRTDAIRLAAQAEPELHRAVLRYRLAELRELRDARRLSQVQQLLGLSYEIDEARTITAAEAALAAE